MTTYFDNFHEAIAEAAQASTMDGFQSGLEAIEVALFADIDRCTSSTGFPDDLRQLIDITLLERATFCFPVNALSLELQGETEASMRAAIRDRLDGLVHALHTHFHDLCRRNIAGASDDPRAPMRALEAQSERRREILVEKWSHASTCGFNRDAKSGGCACAQWRPK